MFCIFLEMGLGKTVETLALILLNPRNMEVNEKENATLIDRAPNVEANTQSDIPMTIEPETEVETRIEGSHNNPIGLGLRCLCINLKSVANTVVCTRCSYSQHRKCVSHPFDGITPDDQYICPACWQTEPKVVAKTTFIVSPTSIKMQWMDEVIKHISDESFKVSKIQN